MSRWRQYDGIVGAVRAGEPLATYVSQNMPLLFVVPVGLWGAWLHGRLAGAALGWLICGSAFNIWWLRYLRQNQHPPAGSAQSIATATSAIAVLIVPELGVVLVAFMLMGWVMGLVNGGRAHPSFQFVCLAVAAYVTLTAELNGLIVAMSLVVSLVPLTLGAISFAMAEMNHRERLAVAALESSGATAWDTTAESTLRSSLGVGIPGVEVGARLSDLVHPDDHRPRYPEPGAVLEYRVATPEGEWRWLRETVEASSPISGQRRSGVTDITDERQANEDDRRRASQDQLTGLPNRASHIEIADMWAAEGKGHLAIIDLDQFKQINDTLGHSMGDDVLRIIASRLAAGKHGTHVARLGGDEFACLIEGDDAESLAIVSELVAETNEPVATNSMTVLSGASAGLARFEPGLGADEVRRRASVALREAKATRGSVACYTAENEVESAQLTALSSQLANALANGEVVVYHQPKIDMRTRELIGFEGLVRWNHPEFGVLSPAAFLDLVAVGGQHRALFRTVLQRGLQDLVRLRVALGMPNLSISINLHAHNLREPDLVPFTLRALSDYVVSPEHLILELTEEAVISEDPAVITALDEFERAHVPLSVDDFGSGFSSLSYLNRLPVAEIKLDRSLVSEVADSRKGRAIADSMLRLAAELGLQVVAEGIEDEATLEYLSEQGCATGQGYFISRPQPVEYWLKGLGDFFTPMTRDRTAVANSSEPVG